MTHDDSTTTATDTGRSVLSSLAQRRQEIAAKQFLRRAVPRWSDPAIVVIYEPLDHSFFRSAQRRVLDAPKRQRAEVELDANVDVLVRATSGIYATFDDDPTSEEAQRFSLRLDDPHGELTKFDGDLARNLLGEEVYADRYGETPPTARDVVRLLFYTGGDILQHAQALADFSGYRFQMADEELRGE